MNNTNHGWTAFLLPFIEQSALANLYRWDRNGGTAGLGQAGPRNFQLKLLQCPSAEADRWFPTTDSITGEPVRGACTDYAATMHIGAALVNLGLVDRVGNSRGALAANSAARLADLTDGTASTILLTEDAGRPGFWRGGQRQASELGCGPWLQWHGCQIVLQGAAPPTYTPPGPCAINCNNNSQIYSFHPGGANFAFADGSVRFLSEKIDIRILARLVTRAGGEIVSANDY